MRKIQESSEAVAKFCARVLDENKCEEVRVLEVMNSLQIADYFVVASGRNPRHLRAASDELSRQLQDAGLRQRKRRGIEGYPDSQWILIDLSDVVVHLFLPEGRRFYDLDNLWGDCPRVAWDGDRDSRAAVARGTRTEG